MGVTALKGLSSLYKAASEAAPAIAKQAKKVISNVPGGALSMLQSAPKQQAKDASTGVSSMRHSMLPTQMRDAGAGAPGMSSAKDSSILSKIPGDAFGTGSSLMQGVAGTAVDMAKTKLSPQHIAAAASDMASDIKTNMNPTNPMAANTPVVNLDKDQQSELDSANITAKQNRKMDMELAKINQQSQFTKALAQQAVDGLKDALSILNSK